MVALLTVLLLCHSSMVFCSRCRIGYLEISSAYVRRLFFFGVALAWCPWWVMEKLWFPVGCGNRELGNDHGFFRLGSSGRGNLEENGVQGCRFLCSPCGVQTIRWCLQIKPHYNKERLIETVCWVNRLEHSQRNGIKPWKYPPWCALLSLSGSTGEYTLPPPLMLVT